MFSLETLLELLTFAIEEIEEAIPLYNSASSVNILKGSWSCEDNNELVLETFNANVVRDDDKIPTPDLVK